jgi:hypothetical protein
MQIRLHVICKPGQSLRTRIAQDHRRLERFGLQVSEVKAIGRKHGWSKIHGQGVNGAINIDWDGDALTLVGRIVYKSKPGDILGRFVDYLWSCHRKRIKTIVIDPE